MPKFAFVVKDQDGKAYKSVMDASNQDAAVETLQKKNYFIISVKELSVSMGVKKRKTKAKKFSHKKIKLEDMLTFSRQLATMLEAGVPLVRSLDVIHQQIVSQKLFNVMSVVKTDVEQGKTLSNAFSKHTDTFNQFWVSLIEVGEASGTIPLILNKLAAYLDQQDSFKRSVTSGLIYPAILFLVSMGAITFFALFVGPRFESIFTTMGVELPLLTVILLTIFSFIKKFFLLIIGVIIILVFALRAYIKTYRGRLIYERFLFSLPKMGEIFKYIIVERFAAQLSILIDAGVPILYALEISEKLVDNNTCALVINDVKEGVKKGELLVDTIDKTDFFPPMCAQLIMVGEETGELSKMLKHISAYYQNTVETFMSRFATVVEPIMLVVMGGIIGTIVIAMFLPLFNISQFGGVAS